MEGKALDSRIGCKVNKCLGPTYLDYKEEVQEAWPVVQRYGPHVIMIDCKEGSVASL